ncbi:Putative K(+)-stimulated pyrophosphate-energized sodium pump [Streptomyces hirsutus]
MAGLSLSHQPSQPISLAAAVLTDDNRVLVVVIGVVALAALAVAGVLVRQVLAAGEGTEKMKEIAAAVQEGANAYLARQAAHARCIRRRRVLPAPAAARGRLESACRTIDVLL